ARAGDAPGRGDTVVRGRGSRGRPPRPRSPSGARAPARARGTAPPSTLSGVLTRSARCSQASEARGEPMAGTASTVRSWLLLEDPGPWGRDALRDSRLPERVGLELQRRCRAAGVRPLLIRRASSNATADGLTCFAIRSG